MLEQLQQAAALGFVTVQKVRGGYAVHGARGDMLLEDELAAAGATWDAVKGFYLVPMTAPADALNAARAAVKTTKAAAVALSARAALARSQGLKLFDKQRKRQQKKITREIADVYRLAMYEHQAELKAIEAKLKTIDKEENPREFYKLLERRGEFESVYDGLAAGLAKAGESAQRLMNAQLQESAEISRHVNAWQIDNMTGVNVSRFLGHDFSALALTGATSYHGKYDLKAWQGVANKKECREAIRKAVARGLLTGEHPSKIARRFQGLFTGDEPLSPHSRAVRIAQTETNRVMNEAAQETYKAANAAGVKCRNRWEATLDSRTRESHKDVDGEIRAVGEKFSNGCTRPGDGGAAESINCRCALTPIVEGFEPDAPMRRDNETGKLIPYMNYREWEAMKKNGNTQKQTETKKDKAAPKRAEELTAKELEKRIKKYGDVMSETAYGHTAYLQNSPDGSKEDYDRYRDARDKYQELKAEKANRAKLAASVPPKTKTKKKVNGYNEATDREITTQTWENALRRNRRDVDSWLGLK